MTNILVTYATAAGSTGEVAEAIGKVLREQGATVDVCRAKQVTDVANYDAVVLGTGVRAGNTYAEAKKFLAVHQSALANVPVASFVVCLTMKEQTEDNCQQAEGYLDALLEAAPGVRPVAKGTFGGVVDYAKLPLLLRFVLKRFIKEPGGDYRDWQAIQDWATATYPALVAAA